MALKVDTKSYLQELIRERSVLDMNEDPEVDHIQDIELRKSKAASWLESRINQLTHSEQFAIIELKKAREAGYLPTTEFYPAQREYHEAFEDLRATARKLYEQAIGTQPKGPGISDAYIQSSGST